MTISIKYVICLSCIVNYRQITKLDHWPAWINFGRYIRVCLNIGAKFSLPAVDTGCSIWCVLRFRWQAACVIPSAYISALVHPLYLCCSTWETSSPSPIFSSTSNELSTCDASLLLCRYILFFNVTQFRLYLAFSSVYYQRHTSEKETKTFTSSPPFPPCSDLLYSIIVTAVSFDYALSYSVNVLNDPPLLNFFLLLIYLGIITHSLWLSNSYPPLFCNILLLQFSRHFVYSLVNSTVALDGFFRLFRVWINEMVTKETN